MTRSGGKNRPTHVVKRNVFEALGFSASETSALKVKAEILSAIVEDVRKRRYTQAQLADILDEYQPSVSNLLRGRISQVSIEKLLRYADRLHLETSIAVRPVTGHSRARQTEGKSKAHSSARKLARAV
jgi:predicted XRE-type DNA-binding protein